MHCLASGWSEVGGGRVGWEGEFETRSLREPREKVEQS